MWSWYEVAVGHTPVRPCRHGKRKPHKFLVGPHKADCDGRRLVAARWVTQPDGTITKELL